MNQIFKAQLDKFFDRHDVFLKSFSEYLPETPLYIRTEVELFEVSKAYRDAYKFEITCKVHTVGVGVENKSIRKKIIKFSNKNNSYLKLIERFGLSLEAKTLYQGLDIYAVHFSGQANLTSLKWEQQALENPIIALSDFGKDLIFRGAILPNSEIMESCNIKIYKSLRKDNEYIVTYLIDNDVLGRKAHCFKIINSVELLQNLSSKESLEEQLEAYENFWDCKHIF